MKEKYEEIKLREMNKIEKTAESISTKVYQICLVLYGIGVIWIAFQFVRSLKNSLLSNYNLSDMVNFWITLIGTLLTFIPVFIFGKNIIRKCINKLKDKIYDILYKRSVVLNDN